MEDNCIVPVPFPFYGSGRTLASVHGIELVESKLRIRSVDEQVEFHRNMIRALEKVLAAH